MDGADDRSGQGARMTADDTTADDAAGATTTGVHDDAVLADPGHGRRELVRIGARAIAAWIAEVVTPGRRLAALAMGVLGGVAMGVLIHPVLARADGEETAVAASVVFGLLVAAFAATFPLTVWLTRAIRRHPSVTGTHPEWRDAGLLDAAVDARGRVTLAPGTAGRVATESRRVIASSSVGIPGAVLLGCCALVGIPAYALAGEAGTLTWFIPIWLISSTATLWAQSRAAGRMALLRDAADAELALPESERTQAPHVDPPHGSRLP
jgi:hypothetical protein